MKQLTLILSFFFIVLSLSSQEIGLSGFYQADLIYDARQGGSVNYTHSFSNIFSSDLKLSYQYTDKPYNTGGLEGSTYHNPKFNITDLGLTFFTTLYDNKLKIMLGTKHSLYYIFGNDYIKYKYWKDYSDGEHIMEEDEKNMYHISFYYSPSNELKFQIKDVIIPNLSLNINLSAGIILNGATVSGCIRLPHHIFAPFGRVSFGVSYNFKK